ncbi:hypothetical protein BGZ58_005364 [Dissophora ornata]|nr:hypothetical protein BGZ58_005364 [Dissophora ornata]
MTTGIRRSSRLVGKAVAAATIVEAMPAIRTSIADATSKAQGQTKQKQRKQATTPTVPEQQHQDLRLETPQKPSRSRKGLKAAEITTEEYAKSVDSSTVATGKKTRKANVRSQGTKGRNANSETQDRKAEKANAQARPKKAKETREVKAEAETEIEQSTAVSLGKKRKAEQVENAVTASAVKSKRTRKANQKNDAKMDRETQAMALTTTPPPTNRTDPCLMFPTEVWHQILSFLPLSQVARISMVSMAWLDGSRNYPVWKTICQTNKALGEPKIKYRSYMALVCSRSCWICDQCYSYSTGKGRASNIPLPVANADDGESIWLMCHACRLEYYNRLPETLEIKDTYRQQKERITKTDACCTYHLSDADLLGLLYQQRRNPHYRNAFPMRLYYRHDVLERALNVHGGWVGVDASSKSIVKKRSVACKERDKGFWTRVPAHGKRKNNQDDGAHLEQITEGDQGQTQVMTVEQTQVMTVEQTQAQTEEEQTQIKIEVLTQATKQEPVEMKINELNSTEASQAQTHAQTRIKGTDNMVGIADEIRQDQVTMAVQMMAKVPVT